MYDVCTHSMNVEGPFLHYTSKTIKYTALKSMNVNSYNISIV